MERVQLPSIPAELRWDTAPLDWRVTDQGLSVTAGPLTDLFLDPEGSVTVTNAPRLLFAPQHPFTLSAKVTVDFKATYDAGVLLIYENESSWGKICFELSPQQQPMIVSVVTRGRSDDCNSLPIEGNQIYLRIASLGRAFAFHYSTDKRFWSLVRYFTLDNPDQVAIGFLAQSPRGDACTVSFAEISYATRKLHDIRSGE